MSRTEPLSGERRRQYCFGGFMLDLESGLLRRDTTEIALRPKSFEVLGYLVERHGRLISREELMQALWPNVAVTDESVTKCIADIRKALNDDSQQLVRTVARRGYLFTAPVTTPVVEFPRLPNGETTDGRPVPLPPNPAIRRIQKKRVIAGAAILLVASALALLLPRTHPVREGPAYVQITNFTDSAVSPALSPDGKILAFIRSENWFLSTDQIYVKMLPNGEPVQITHDPHPKYGLSFSLDGSRIAYTIFPWTALTIPVLGGEPHPIFGNSAGVSWLDPRHILFSEISSGIHMGVVTATENRSEYRKIYFPLEERGMAHLSYASPDRKWALVTEMNPVWQPCRVVPLDGSTAGRQAGPNGKCTSTAWSPDQRWMYFGVEVDGNHHLWRQRFPNGEPEQITSGTTEEDGVAVDPDGRSLITSIGMHQSAAWIHDARGERPISSQGYVPDPDKTGLGGTLPRFTRDGKSLYYLRSESPGDSTELWRADLETEKSDRVLPGFFMSEFDISSDGKEVLFSTPNRQLWLAALDRSSPPQMISDRGEDSPHFGPDGVLLYRMSDGTKHYLGRINRDGSGRAKVTSYDVGNIVGMSPDQRWISAMTNTPGGSRGGTFAVPADGGAVRRICGGCFPLWAPDGKYLFLSLQQPSLSDRGKTRVVQLPPGEMLPELPPSGMTGVDDPKVFPGSRLMEGFRFSPGPDPSTFAYVKTTMHRNLFRIPLQDK